MSRIASFPRRSRAVLTAVALVVAFTAPAIAADRSKGPTTALVDTQANSKAKQNRTVASMEPFRGSDLARHLPNKKPWPAPIGHRQPRASDVAASAPSSSFDLEEQRLDRELNAKLVICRGC